MLVAEHRDKHEKIDLFISTLKRQETLLTEFDEELWVNVVDKVIVYDEENIRLSIKDGSTIKL